MSDKLLENKRGHLSIADDCMKFKLKLDIYVIDGTGGDEIKEGGADYLASKSRIGVSRRSGNNEVNGKSNYKPCFIPYLYL